MILQVTPNGTYYVTNKWLLGILNKYQLSNLLTPSEVKIVLPKNRIKPRVYLLWEGTTLFLGGVGRIDYLSGPRAYFTGNVTYIYIFFFYFIIYLLF